MRKFLEKAAPLSFIIILWLLFCSPFLLKGNIPFPGDYEITFFAPWNHYPQFATPVKNNAMPDVIDQLYPWKHLVINDWRAGKIPLWNPYQFGGTPLLANYQSAVFSPMNLLFFLLPFNTAWALLILLQPLLAGVGMYCYTRKLAISKIAATLASVSFMFCSFIVTWMGYGTLGYAVAVLPFALLGLEGFIQTKRFRYLLLISFSLAFSFLSGHFQMSLYVLLASSFYFLFRFIPTKNIRAIAVGFIGIVVGVCLASIQIFPSIAFYLTSLRSSLFQRPEVIPWQYFITLLAPDFLGNPVTRNDWFGHYAEWGSYIGVVPLVFALFSTKDIIKNKFVLFFSFLGVLALLLATPTIFGDAILYLHIPVLATSAAGRIIILLSFSLSVLGGFGLDTWMKSSKRIVLLPALIAGILLVIGWSVIFLKPGLSVSHVVIARQNFLLPSVFLFIVIITSLLALVVKTKRIVVVVGILLLLITAFDMYRFAQKWQSFSPQSSIFPDIGITKFFTTIQNKRSLGDYGGEVSLYYQIPSLDGYDALYPESIGYFANYIGTGNIQPGDRSVVEFPKNGKYTMQALNLLGVSYIIQPVGDMGKSWAFPIQNYPTKDFQIVYKDASYLVFKNMNVYPRAFVVDQYVVRPDTKSALQTLFSNGFNSQTTLVLPSDPNIRANVPLVAHAKITSYTADTVTIDTTSNRNALLFLSDTYFPGWYASVDGRQVPIYRADDTFRAVPIPLGMHTVIFSYMPSSFMYGVVVSVLSVAILIFLYFSKKRVFYS